MMILRILHVFFSAFILGYYMVMFPILLPRLKRLGPAIQGPVVQAIMPILTPVMMISAIVVFSTGTALTLIMRQGHLDALVSTSWGWIILLGIILTVVLLVLAYGIILPTSFRIKKLSKEMQGRTLTQEEHQKISGLSTFDYYRIPFNDAC
jgi:uncharacterized membrane protein